MATGEVQGQDSVWGNLQAPGIEEKLRCLDDKAAVAGHSIESFGCRKTEDGVFNSIGGGHTVGLRGFDANIDNSPASPWVSTPSMSAWLSLQILPLRPTAS